MNTPTKKDKPQKDETKTQPVREMSVISWEETIKELNALTKERKYLQEKVEAEKKLLCQTFNVEDEKGKLTGAERTICRQSGSAKVVFAWDSREGDLLKNPSSPARSKR